MYKVNLSSKARFAGVVLSLIVVLGGCSSSSETMDQPMPVDPAHSSAEKDSGYKIPPRPVVEPLVDPELTGDNRNDAIIVARHFVQTYPYMLKTGDVSYWQRYSAPECEFCQEVLASTERRNKSGAWIDGDIAFLEQVNGIVDESQAKYEIQFLVERTGVVQHLSEGDESVTDEKYHVVVSLEKKENWLVTRFQIGRPEGFTGGIG
ncbi:DUF6318 family protein [Arcanobacterium pinnipediorum]|uniref:DUF6318 family protein n=1 Tax=Arcanobacterium pinnipediorum TaxID=1503041 RepID=A0ABY5AIM0_9ACTO|nr:DUF6318 family protein [Arcanobacterium pinnipediorum]USR80060.1 DUF6318 family protein [Arcanobacterium pinnipediorum]